MKKENITYQPENVGYLVCWHDWKSRESEGITLTKDIMNLANKLKWAGEDPYNVDWLEHSKPKIQVFENLEQFLKDETQIWKRYYSEIPRRRNLTNDEIDLTYNLIKPQLIKIATPSQLSYILKAFLNQDGDYFEFS